VSGDGVDEILVSSSIRTCGYGERLPVSLGAKPARIEVGNPDLNRPQALAANAVARAGRLWDWRRGLQCAHNSILIAG